MEGYIACFIPEIAFFPHEKIRSHTGGLGYLARSFLKSAYEQKINIFGVTILPRQGYYDQTIHEYGMDVEYVSRYYDDILERPGIKFQIPLCGTLNWVEARLLKEGTFGLPLMIFLSTDDIPENDAAARTNTLQLYGGSVHSGANIERKIAQSLVLARGGLETIRRLALPVRLYHIHESHTAFVALELAHQDGFTRSSVVFSTHTPVEAGNPKYPVSIVAQLGGYDKNILIRLGGDPFNVTAMALKLCRKANAVSRKHFQIAERMWHWVENHAPLTYITNGVHRDDWQYPEFRDAQTPDECARAKQAYKRRMIKYLKEKTRYCSANGFSEDILTICWARRFEEYKRPELVFAEYRFPEMPTNLEWVKQNLHKKRIQIVFAGKPHPDNYEMINCWNRIFARAKSGQFPNLVILPEYDLEMSKILKAGSDVWLNTPRAPYEACGTSGIGAAFNCTINVSTPDGWMHEADPRNCFLFGSDGAADLDQDSYDAKELQICIDKRVIPFFYGNKKHWYAMALAAKQEAEEYLTSDRMIREYNERLYKQQLVISD